MQPNYVPAVDEVSGIHVSDDHALYRIFGNQDIDKALLAPEHLYQLITIITSLMPPLGDLLDDFHLLTQDQSSLGEVFQ